MNKLTKDVLKTIDKYDMIKNASTVFAAVSGGADSLCMLFVLNDLRRIRHFELRAVHLNHLFRDDASDDERFVSEMCSRLGIALYSKKANVAEYANKNKISFETAGRELRYEYFDELMSEIENSVTATAHNANDNAESFIMHLVRGSGLGGLTGIPPVRGKIIRPLIEQSRLDIEKYCALNNLTPRIDITNFDDSYTRNDIRHNVMPPLAERDGIKAIARTASLLSADEDFLQEYTKEIACKYISRHNGNTEIEAKAFNSLHIALKRRLLRRIFEGSEKEISQIHIDSIISIAEKNYGGKTAVVPGGITAKLEKGKIIITNEVRSHDK